MEYFKQSYIWKDRDGSIYHLVGGRLQELVSLRVAFHVVAIEVAGMHGFLVVLAHSALLN